MGQGSNTGFLPFDAEAGLAPHLATAGPESGLGGWDLRPHFVLNALHSIASLVRKNEGEDALALLSALGAMVQRSVETAGREVTFGEEVAFADNYVQVERVRFGRKLSLRVELPGGLRSALVPSFALQPLIEDVVRHVVGGGGLGAERAFASLAVRARRVGRCLEIEVRGACRDGSSRRGRSPDTFGVSQLRTRLDAAYGSAYHTAVIFDEGGVAIARLRIPLRRQTDEEESAGSIRSVGC